MNTNMIPESLGESPSPIDEQGNLYHAFMSYKSQDSDLVRTVTEWLMSVGLRIWFAEYQILLHDREKFQTAIDHGITHSQCGIAFTNAAYVESEHCRNELSALASRAGRESTRILEVVLGETPLVKDYLPQSRQALIVIPHRFSDLSALLKWLSHQLELDDSVADLPTIAAGGDMFEGMAGSYSMDLSGWATTSNEEGWQHDRIFQGPAFRFITNKLLRGNLTIASVRGVDRKSIQYGTDISFQRNYFNALIGIAAHEFRDASKKCVGVHLIHKDGQVHFATTSRIDKEWRRDYYIELPDAYANGLEFALSFRYEGTFQDFCRHLIAADAVAQSLWFDSRLRYVTLINLQARESISKHGFEFSWSPPIGWKRTALMVTKDLCDLDLRRERQGFLKRLLSLFTGRREETMRQKTLKDVESLKDLLNVQVHHCPSGFCMERLESRVRRTIEVNGGTLTFHMNGNRHGVRTYECLYHWTRRGHSEYGFQVHFILGNQVFSVQINSLKVIAKGDERVLLASAFADGIRVPDVDGAFEPERKRELERISDGETAAASHFRAVRMTVAPPKCQLALAAAVSEGSNVYLTYRWTEDLSHDEADRIDTCVRALINSSIGDIAHRNKISARLSWGAESMNGVRIPLWHLDHRDQPTFVVNSGFDVEQKLVTLTVGPRFVRRQIDDDMHDPTSVGLCRGFTNLLGQVEIKPINQEI